MFFKNIFVNDKYMSQGVLIKWGEGSAIQAPFDTYSDVTKVVGGSNNHGHYLALRSDGTVFQFDKSGAYDSSSDMLPESDLNLNNITDIFMTKNYGYAALRSDGSLATWGQYITE